MKTLQLLTAFILLLSAGCSTSSSKKETETNNLLRAGITLDSLYAHYSVSGTKLLRENYPFDSQYKATYLASEENNLPNQYSYLWPYSGTFSAVNALYEATHDSKYKELLDNTVLPGLEEYFDTSRTPYGYASYIRTAPQSDRFYDDNVWLGIDFTDIFSLTREPHYLEKAKLIWDFVLSGNDDKLGGGIYWCEQKKASKNTCSNAPAAVFAFKLFKATGDSTYYHKGKELYEWTKEYLQDESDKLYYDNINLEGNLGKAKYAYNSGQMLQSAAMLYNMTQNKEYLTEAEGIARSCYDYFFHEFTSSDGQTFRILNEGDVWFTAVMLRGFVELYHINGDEIYLTAFNNSLDYAWNHARDEKGLFHTDYSGQKKNSKKWLLTQAAMVEMYARLTTLK